MSLIYTIPINLVKNRDIPVSLTINYVLVWSDRDLKIYKQWRTIS